jgi:hypothetical protein
VTDRPTAIERAYILAASGRMNSVGEIKQALRAEGYTEKGQLYGHAVIKQLSTLIADAKAKDRK